jgi:hypothetical protein
MNPPNPSPVGNRRTRHEPAKPATNWDGDETQRATNRLTKASNASRSLCARKVPEKQASR